MVNKFEKIKREELEYIDSIAQISSNKILSETEKLEIYRTLNSYEIKLNEILKKLWSAFPMDDSLTKENLKDLEIKVFEYFDVERLFIFIKLSIR